MQIHETANANAIISRPGEVHDPVCGMKFLPDVAAGTVEHQGQTYYFCSLGCAAKFKADPTKYLSPANVPVPKAGRAKHTYALWIRKYINSVLGHVRSVGWRLNSNM